MANWRGASPNWPSRKRWQIEELHTEEGRLDEVFRNITLPETARDRREGGNEMNSSVANIKTITKRELSGYFASPVAYVFIVIFLLLAGFFTFMAGGFFERNQANLTVVLSLASVALSVSGPGCRHAALVRRTAHGHDGIAADHADHRLAGDRRKISGLVAVSGAGAGLTFPVVITVNYLGHPDNGVIFGAYVGSLLMAGAYLAISCMTSALTRNQVVSFILSVVICLFLILAGWPPVTRIARAIHRKSAAWSKRSRLSAS